MDINPSFNPFNYEGYLGRLRYSLYWIVYFSIALAITFAVTVPVTIDILNSCDSPSRCESDIEAANNFFLYFGLTLTYLFTLGFTARRCRDLGLAPGLALLQPATAFLSLLSGIGVIFDLASLAVNLILCLVPATPVNASPKPPKTQAPYLKKLLRSR